MLNLEQQFELSGNYEEDSQFLKTLLIKNISAINKFIEEEITKEGYRRYIEFATQTFQLAELWKKIAEGTDEAYDANLLYRKLVRIDANVTRAYSLKLS